jgi:phage terminase large subunit-like protein
MNDFVTEVAILSQDIQKYRETHKLEFYTPYLYQKRFHEAKDRRGRLAGQRGLMCGNQVGKCASITTLIDTTKGKRRLRDIWGKKGIEIISWPDKIPRKVTKWIKKPSEECFRIVMSDGQWFECPKGHVVLVGDEWFSIAEIFSSLPKHVLHDLGFLKGVRRDVHHLFGTLRGFWDRCFVDHRLCGGQLLSEEDNVQVFSPLKDDVPARTLLSYNEDVQENKHTNILYRVYDHLSNLDVFRLFLGQCISSLNRAFLPFFQCQIESSPVALQLDDFEYPAQTGLSEERYLSSLKFPNVDGNQIVSVYPVGVHTLYDMEVDGGNYTAGGLVHHNTFCGCREDAFHLTGLYHDDWEGHVFKKPVMMLIAGKTNDSTKNIVQAELFGDPLDKEKFGTGAIPIDCIGEITRKAGVPNALSEVLIKHHTNGKFDGWSKCILMSYEMKAKAFMGYKIDVGHGDEEPPSDVWDQFIRATLSTNGILYITFTPEEGITDVVHKFMNEPGDDQVLVKAGWDDAPHMTPDKRQENLKKYPPHQRDMRSKGVPLMGTGLIWPVDESSITVENVDIKPHWPRIIGLDFGWDHPFAIVCCAYDRDSKIFYIYDAFRRSNAIISTQVDAIKSRGEWIPVAWPHDGMKNDPKSGKPLANIFREKGANMHRDCFTNPPGPGQKEGQGGNGVWVGLSAILQAMETGQFKVFSHLTEWFEEWRMYHRKSGDEVVKLNDDLMSATRYAFMMRRHAMTKPVRHKQQQIHSGLSNW